jgi:hypothetical protein
MPSASQPLNQAVETVGFLNSIGDLVTAAQQTCVILECSQTPDFPVLDILKGAGNAADLFSAAQWALIGVQLVVLSQQVQALQDAKTKNGSNPPSPKLCAAATAVYNTVRTIQSELPPPWSFVPSGAIPPCSVRHG